MGVFDKFQSDAWPYRFKGRLRAGKIMGGTPSDPKVAEGWLKAKLLKGGSEAALQEATAQLMLDRQITDPQEAITAVNELKHLNGFKRNEHGLYVEGRQLKAALKEAASVAVAAGKLDLRGWGKTSKSLVNFLAEHVFVLEDLLPLGVTEPTGVEQRFVHTYLGSGIQYEEYVLDAEIDFTVVTDFNFTEREWAIIWLTGSMQGLGASRSMGFGRYEILQWESTGKPVPPRAARRAAKEE